ncbi:MAG: SPOR domain-containing protein [Myxococcota bacterium]
MVRVEGNAVIRQLEQIQEEDPRDHTGGGRVTAMVMASFGGACIVFGALALMRTDATESAGPNPEEADPLGALVARSDRDNASEDDDDGRNEEARGLAPDDVTFPTVLTDRAAPTTAMEAVRNPRSDLPLVDDVGAGRYAEPPPATDRLPVVPLPGAELLETTPTPRVSPNDTLREMAVSLAREPEGALAESGRPGGYQLQVSSFKAQGDADAFALSLRRRGHKAYVVAANVKGRGLWHRVRIGPFKYRRSAVIYKQDFEAKERLATFVVNPPKTKIHIAPAEGGGESSNP